LHQAGVLIYNSSRIFLNGLGQVTKNLSSWRSRNTNSNPANSRIWSLYVNYL